MNNWTPEQQALFNSLPPEKQMEVIQAIQVQQQIEAARRQQQQQQLSGLGQNLGSMFGGSGGGGSFADNLWGGAEASPASQSAFNLEGMAASEPASQVAWNADAMAASEAPTGWMGGANLGGVLAGAYTGAKQIGGMKNFFEGDDLSTTEKAALALPTFGLSFAAKPLQKMFGLRSVTKDREKKKVGGLRKDGYLPEDFKSYFEGEHESPDQTIARLEADPNRNQNQLEYAKLIKQGKYGQEADNFLDAEGLMGYGSLAKYSKDKLGKDYMRDLGHNERRDFSQAILDYDKQNNDFLKSEKGTYELDGNDEGFVKFLEDRKWGSAQKPTQSTKPTSEWSSSANTGAMQPQTPSGVYLKTGSSSKGKSSSSSSSNSSSSSSGAEDVLKQLESRYGSDTAKNYSSEGGVGGPGYEPDPNRPGHFRKKKR